MKGLNLVFRRLQFALLAISVFFILRVGVSFAQAIEDELIDTDNKCSSAMLIYLKGDGNALDSSGNGFDATLKAGATASVVGKVNNAFSTGQGFVRVNQPNFFSKPDAISVSGWFRTTSTNTSMIFSVEGAYAIYHINGSLKPFFDGSSRGNPSLGSGLNDGDYHHFVTMNDGATTTLYIDGTLAGTHNEGLYNIDKLNRYTTIGAQYNGKRRFSGQIDEFAIFTRALSQDEVERLYLNGIHSLDNCQASTVAVCQDATLSLDESGTATLFASDVDGGSFDAYGEGLTYSISDSSFTCNELGTSLVTLTVSNGQSESSCVAKVTTLDELAPVITTDAPQTMVPSDAPLTIIATSLDNCGPSSTQITEYDCFKINGGGKRVDKTDSCVVSLSGDSMTISDSGGVGDNITYTTTATDSSGNTTTTTSTIEVLNPGKGGGGSSDANEGVGNGVDGNTPGHDNNGGNDDPEFSPGNPGAKGKKK